jgi:hypothetical protein
MLDLLSGGAVQKLSRQTSDTAEAAAQQLRMSETARRHGHTD